MKTVKIFIASSIELEKERETMALLANSLNTVLEKQGIHVIAVEWENIDASMGIPHKQEDYNERLRECDICIVLYWTKFGMYTKMELDTALEQMKVGNNPQKIYVYFKEGSEPTAELKEFRDSFPTKYGHFYTSFGNLDTLRAHFLLQFMEYQSQILKHTNTIEVKNGKVIVDGKEYVNLKNVPFAGNNEEYNLLQKNISDKRELLKYLPVDNPIYNKQAEELQEMEDKLSKMESSLWDTALLITRLSTTKCSERLQRAMELFSNGDNKGAQAVLNEEEIEKDVQHNLNLIKLGEEGRKGIAINIKEYRLKIRSLENEMEENWYMQVDQLYRKCIEIGIENIAKEDYAEILSDYGDFLMGQKEYDEVENIYKESIAIYRELEASNTQSYDDPIQWILMRLSELYILSNQYTLAEETLAAAFEILKDYGDGARKAQTLYHLAYIHERQLKNEIAEEELKKAITIVEDDENSKDILVECLYHIGLLYKNTNRYEDAKIAAENALNICLDNYGEIDASTAKAYHLLGNIFSCQGENNEAIKMHEKSKGIDYELIKKGGNAYRIELACDFANLSYLHSSIEEYDIAINELKDALKIATTLFNQHPLQYSEYYARFTHDLALILKSMMRYDEAAELLKKSLYAYDILKNSDAEIHLFQMANSYNTLGCVYLENFNYEEAEKALKSALDLRRGLVANYGDNYQDIVAQTLINIALLNTYIYKFQEAEAQYLELIEIYKHLTKKYNQKHEGNIALVYLNLAWLYLSQKNYEKSIEYGNVSVQTFNDIPKSQIIDQLQHLSLKTKALHNLAIAYYRNGNTSDAFTIINEAIKIADDLSKRNPNVYKIQLSNIYNELAWFKYKNEENTEAEIVASKSYEIAVECDVKKSIRASLDTLACIHRELGKLDIAEEEFRRCIFLCKELFSNNTQFYAGRLAHEHIELAKLYIKIGNKNAFSKAITEALNYIGSLDENHKQDIYVLDDLKELKIIQENEL